MKTILLLSLFSIGLISNVFADDAPLAIVQGGAVKPINNNDVQMQSETIDITLFKDFFTVDVNYTFVNKGKAQEVIMGFPSPSGPDSIYYFRAFDNKTELEIFQKETEWHYTPPATCSGVSYYPEKLLNQFQCHSVYFQKSEIKNIRNSYKQRYNDTKFEDSILLFHYVLKTGAFWKGKIESVEVRVHTENLPYYYDVDSACFNDDKVSLKNFYRKYTNIEPTEDLAFKVTMKQGLVPVSASSTLPATDSCNYDISNLVDGDPTTAWVESKGGYSIDETVWFHDFYNVNKIYGIGIVNGFAKSKEVFDNHCKVYCLEIEGWRDGGIQYEYSNYELKGDPDRVVYSFIIDDIMDMQYFYFKYPMLVSDIKLTLISKHHVNVKGVSYNTADPNVKTAISEIKFLTKVKKGIIEDSDN